MDITKSREEFEKWADGEFNDLSRGIYTGSNECVYLDSEVECCWKAWQASRESIEVELPMRLSPCRSGYGYTLIPNDIGEALEYDNVVEALRTAGIRIKGESE